MAIPYTLVRSCRKTVSIGVDRDLQVTVRAPMRMPVAVVERFVAESEEWVRRQMEYLHGQAELRAAFTCADGDRLPFSGEELILDTAPTHRAMRQGEKLLLPQADRTAVLTAFLREEAHRRVTERIAHFAPLMGVLPTAVKITSAATRWGSCSGNNSLNFSFRTACLPDVLFDYVVVHELAHIREHNHSARFWAVVATIMPDFAERRAALRRFQQQIPF